MKLCSFFPSILAACAVSFSASARPLNVVTTLPDYADVARQIGGERVQVKAIVRGEQDAHHIRPKPSFVSMVRQADVLIDTGLDLEMWLPTVIDKSGNTRVRSGQPGYVAAAKGIQLLDKPKSISRIEGGVHIYGNPHITTSPVNMRTVARNIANGLINNDRDGKDYYTERLKDYVQQLDEHLFGKELVDLLGGDTLAGLATKGTLHDFLASQEYEGKPLLDRLGGWMKQMEPLRNQPIITYHKNWVYFTRLFGIEEAGTIEPKPGIPPSPKHVLEITQLMETRHIGIIFAASYFDPQKIDSVAERVGAKAVVVPPFVGGTPDSGTYFDLMNLWVKKLTEAAGEASSGK